MRMKAQVEFNGEIFEKNVGFNANKAYYEVYESSDKQNERFAVVKTHRKTGKMPEVLNVYKTWKQAFDISSNLDDLAHEESDLRMKGKAEKADKTLDELAKSEYEARYQ